LSILPPNQQSNQSRQILKQPKRLKSPKHLAKVASLGCILCGSPSQVHHIRTGQGMGLKASDFDTIPLCERHHTGKEGIHTCGSRVWQMRFGTEIELLEKTRELLDADSRETKIGHLPKK